MAVVEKSVKNLQELISEVLEISSKLPPNRFLWFRGDSSSEYHLLPKIMRDSKNGDEVLERESRLLTRFRQRSMPFWTKMNPQTEWDFLFAMQHFGMPTRLLDWSENLFVSAYFALSMGNPGPEAKATIWCLDPIAWNQSNPVLSEYGDTIQVLTTANEELEAYQTNTNKRRYKTPVAIYGAHNSDRIVAQRGTFFVWANETKALEGYAKDLGCSLYKIVLDAPREQLSSDLMCISSDLI